MLFAFENTVLDGLEALSGHQQGSAFGGLSEATLETPKPAPVAVGLRALGANTYSTELILLENTVWDGDPGVRCLGCALKSVSVRLDTL